MATSTTASRSEKVRRGRKISDSGEESDVAPSIVSILDGASARDMDTKEVAFRELGETEEIRERALEKVRILMSESTILYELIKRKTRLNLSEKGDESDLFLLRFLRLNKFNAKRSVDMLERHLLMKIETPNWFMGLGRVDEIERALELLDGYIFVAPGRDRKGRKVMVNVAQRLDVERHTSSDMMKAIMMTLETLFMMDHDTQVRGLSYIFYCRGLTLKHCGLWSLSDARKMFTVCEKNIPLRHRSIFISDTPFGMGAVIEFAKSFVQPKMRHRIHVISDARTLHLEQERVLDDPRVLPVEFLGSENGGELTISDMAAAWKKIVKEHLPRLDILDDLKVPLSGGKS